MKDHFAKSAEAIKTKECCESAYCETVKVREEFEGKIVWDGEVEIFELLNHPKAKRCYAFGYNLKKMISSGLKPDHIFVVLELPPVDTPQKAVRATVAAVAKQLFGKE